MDEDVSSLTKNGTGGEGTRENQISAGSNDGCHVKSENGTRDDSIFVEENGRAGDGAPIRRRLSKQKETVDESTASSTLLSVDVNPEREGSLAQDQDTDETACEVEVAAAACARPARQLVRGLALCGDDDTRLRPPAPVAVQPHPHSLSRESSGTEYTDSSGLDLRTFVSATLHKNPRDRQMILGLEQQLTDFVNDAGRQAFKFPTMSSYNRMLIHRMAVIFGLDHNVDNSGQCVVVNKTKRTTLPDFEFSSLIRGNIYTDVKRPMRSADSQEERASSLMGSGQCLTGDAGWNTRRAHSFETSSAMMTPAGGGDMSWNGRSFDRIPSTSPRPPQWNTDRTAMLRKAGSFGGVPAYYRTSGSHMEYPRNIPMYNGGGSHGSVSRVSPRPAIDELSECVRGMQVDVDPQMVSPVAMPSPVPHSANMMYSGGPPAYYPAHPQHAVYVPQPTAMAAYPSPTGLSSNLPVHPVNVMQQPIQYGPPQCVQYGQWSGPTSPYGYYDNNTPVSGQVGMYTVRGPATVSLPLNGQKMYAQGPTDAAYYSPQQPVPPQQQAADPQYSPLCQSAASQRPPDHVTMSPTSSEARHPGLSSMDRGYGSMTQDS